MKLLLDTHVLIWALADPGRLETGVRETIASPDHVVFASLVSLWELQIKVSLGKVRLPAGFLSRLQPAGFEILPISLQHIESLAKLPPIHRDPFDRMLVSQAQCEDLTLVTRDEEILRYPVQYLKA